MQNGHIAFVQGGKNLLHAKNVILNSNIKASWIITMVLHMKVATSLIRFKIWKYTITQFMGERNLLNIHKKCHNKLAQRAKFGQHMKSIHNYDLFDNKFCICKGLLYLLMKERSLLNVIHVVLGFLNEHIWIFTWIVSMKKNNHLLVWHVNVKLISIQSVEKHVELIFINEVRSKL